jgi:hypothetical protein
MKIRRMARSLLAIGLVAESFLGRTASNPGLGTATSGGELVSYADRVCPPYADQPGVIFSALGLISFCFTDFEALLIHMSTEFLDQ